MPRAAGRHRVRRRQRPPAVRQGRAAAFEPIDDSALDHRRDPRDARLDRGEPVRRRARSRSPSQWTMRIDGLGTIGVHARSCATTRAGAVRPRPSAIRARCARPRAERPRARPTRREAGPRPVAAVRPRRRHRAAPREARWPPALRACRSALDSPRSRARARAATPRPGARRPSSRPRASVEPSLRPRARPTPAPRVADRRLDGPIDDAPRARRARRTRATSTSSRSAPMLLRVAGELVPRGAADRRGLRGQTIVGAIVPERLRPQLETRARATSRSTVPRTAASASTSRASAPASRPASASSRAEIPTLESLGLPPEIATRDPPPPGAHRRHRARPGTARRARSRRSSTSSTRETTHHIITVEDPVEYVHPRKQRDDEPARGRHAHRGRSPRRSRARSARTPTSSSSASCATPRPCAWRSPRARRGTSCSAR